MQDGRWVCGGGPRITGQLGCTFATLDRDAATKHVADFAKVKA